MQARPSCYSVPRSLTVVPFQNYFGKRKHSMHIISFVSLLQSITVILGRVRCYVLHINKLGWMLPLLIWLCCQRMEARHCQTVYSRSSCSIPRKCNGFSISLTAIVNMHSETAWINITITVSCWSSQIILWTTLNYQRQSSEISGRSSELLVIFRQGTAMNYWNTRNVRYSWLCSTFNSLLIFGHWSIEPWSYQWHFMDTEQRIPYLMQHLSSGSPYPGKHVTSFSRKSLWIVWRPSNLYLRHIVVNKWCGTTFKEDGSYKIKGVDALANSSSELSRWLILSYHLSTYDGMTATF